MLVLTEDQRRHTINEDRGAERNDNEANRVGITCGGNCESVEQAGDYDGAQGGCGNGQRKRRSRCHQRSRDHSAQHQKTALGEIDDITGIENNCQTERRESIDRSRRQSAEEILEESWHWWFAAGTMSGGYDEFAVLNFDHSERRCVEAAVVGRRERVDSTHPDEAPDILQSLPNLAFFSGTRAPDRIGGEHDPVIGVAAEGRDIDLVPSLKGRLVCDSYLLLRIVVRKTLCKQQRGRRHPDSFGCRSGDADKFIRCLTVRCI